MFESLGRKNKIELCKHNKPILECELCKMTEEEAFTDATLIKVSSLQQAAAFKLDPKKDPEQYKKYASYEKKEQEIANLTNEATPHKNSYVQNSPENKLEEKLKIGNLVNSLEAQIFSLKKHLDKIKSEPWISTYYKYSEMPEEKLKEEGIIWKKPTSEEIRGEIFDKIEKSQGKKIE